MSDTARQDPNPGELWAMEQPKMRAAVSGKYVEVVRIHEVSNAGVLIEGVWHGPVANRRNLRSAGRGHFFGRIAWRYWEYFISGDGEIIPKLQRI